MIRAMQSIEQRFLDSYLSNIDIISAMCMLMARGAVVSMLSVIFILPALLLLCDGLVCVTTLDMRKIRKSQNRTVEVTSK